MGMRSRFKRPQTIVGLGGVIVALSYFLAESFSGGFSLTWPLSIGQWASICGIAVGIGLIIWGLLKDESDTAKDNPLERIKADLVNMNICQKELAIKKAQQVCPKEVAMQIYNDFIALFGNDMATFIMSLMQKTLRDRTVDALIEFYKTFADILDSNQYGLKVELEENELYKASRMDLAQKRLKLKVGKKRDAIIQKNINRVCSLTYGLNSSILLRGILRTAPKLTKLIPATIKTNLENIETATEKTLTSMLNDLENEWKVNINALYILWFTKRNQIRHVSRHPALLVQGLQAEIRR
jgi:hypothetical protein